MLIDSIAAQTFSRPPLKTDRARSFFTQDGPQVVLKQQTAKWAAEYISEIRLTSKGGTGCAGTNRTHPKALKPGQRLDLLISSLNFLRR
jgi:hypothetical protein